MDIIEYAMAENDIDIIFEKEVEKISQLREQFNDEFISDGGVADLRQYDYFNSKDSLINYHRTVQKAIAYQTARLKEQDVDHTIYFDFINSPLNNAFCSTKGNVSYLAIHIGTWVKMHWVFSFLSKLMEQDLEHLCVDTIKDYSDKLRYILEIDNLKELYQLREKYHDYSFSDFSRNATIIAVESIVAHEMFHIILGHTGLLNEFRDGYRLYENEYLGLNESPLFLPNIDYHTIEFEADLYCARKIALGYENDRIVTHRRKLDDQKYHILLSFSITTLFEVFDIYNSMVQEYNLLKHPHPALRYIVFFHSLKAFLPKLKFSSSTEDWKRSRSMALDYLALLQIRETPTEPIDLMDKGELDEFFEQYEVNSQRIFDLRQKYSLPL